MTSTVGHHRGPTAAHSGQDPKALLTLGATKTPSPPAKSPGGGCPELQNAGDVGPRPRRPPPQADPATRPGSALLSIHAPTWKTNPLSGGGRGHQTQDDGENSPSPLGAVKCLGLEPLRAEPPTAQKLPLVPRPQPGQEPKARQAALPPACFSPQRQEGGRLSFFPGQEQGRIRFPCVPTPCPRCCRSPACPKWVGTARRAWVWA